YEKIHLVPFGEYVPFRNSFPIFVWLTGGVIEQDFSPGTSYDNLDLVKGEDTIKIAPLICFEDTLARHARKTLLEGVPQIFVNVTNDGWFYDSVQPQQHFANAMFRCIEFRRPMIRAANTGVSGVIDARGSAYERNRFMLVDGEKKPILRTIHDMDTGYTFISGSLPATIAIDRDPPTTIYAKIGDTFSIAMGSFATVYAAAYFWLTRRTRKQKQNNEA
ncbi:MAG: apolipoprotein N-acyltransferase, partial [Verrucomicrobiota bacterium]